MKSDGSSRYLSFVGLALASLGLFASCAATDVVARYASSSFSTMARAMDAVLEGGYLVIRSPTEEKFALARDFAGTPDALLSIDATPFLASGLDPARLPADTGSSWVVEEGCLVGRFELAPGGRADSADPKALMAKLASAARNRIGYHAQMGHYGVMLDDFAMVEWAADARKNDKDWVLILDPGLISQAGGDPQAVEGWILAMVPVDGPDGKMIEVQKLLRPYDIIRQ